MYPYLNVSLFWYCNESACILWEGITSAEELPNRSNHKHFSVTGAFHRADEGVLQVRSSHFRWFARKSWGRESQGNPFRNTSTPKILTISSDSTLLLWVKSPRLWTACAYVDMYDGGMGQHSGNTRSIRSKEDPGLDWLLGLKRKRL